MEKTPKWTREQARQMVILYFLDYWGRYQGSVVPFYVYRHLPNYEPLKPGSRYEMYLGIETAEIRMMREKVKQLGLDFPAYSMVVDDVIFELQISCVQWILDLHYGYLFTSHDIEAMIVEAQTRSVERYELLKLKVQVSKKGKELALSIPDLYDLYGENLVFFLKGYCGIGKTTWIHKQSKALFYRKTVVMNESLNALVVRPLTNLLVVDSGISLPESGQITRGQVLHTIPLSVEQYAGALKEKGPIAIVDTGDNVGQRVAMAVQAREIRGPSCPIHVELLDATFLESVVRNHSRKRKEYTLQTWQVHEAFHLMCEVFATSWNRRDFSSQQYHRLYRELYMEQKCNWVKPFGRACEYFAHLPEVQCEKFCMCCSRHCPHKRRWKFTNMT